MHGIGKRLDINPRGPNLKLRKRYRQMIENELEFDRRAETGGGGGGGYVTKGEIEEVRAEKIRC